MSQEMLDDPTPEEEYTPEERLAWWLENHPEPAVSSESGHVIEKFENLVAAFESTHSLEALRAIAVLSVEDAPSHPVREPAHKDLALIFAQRKVLRLLKDQGKIDPQRYDELEQKWEVLSAAVGMIRTLEGNRVDHDIEREK